MIKFRGLKSGAVYTAAFSANGQQVVSGAADFLLRVWALGPAPASKRELPGHYSSVRDASFSRDGRWLLSGAGNQLGLSCLGGPGPGPGAPPPCEADQMLLVNTPHKDPKVGAVRALAVAPTRPQLAVVDAAGELNLFRTDHRTALWRQQPVCMAEPQRQTALRETGAQAEAGARQCRLVVAACQRSAAECGRALADAALR